jgi:hypothetical protein
VAAGERSEREQIGLRVGEHRGDLRMGPTEHCGHLAELFLDVLAVRLGEDRSKDRRHHLLGSFRHHREDVAHEMDPASLPTSTLEHCPDGLLQPGVRVGHDQLHPVEAAGFQRPQEARPEALVLAVTNVEAEYFTAPVSSHPDRNNDSPGDDPVTDPGLAVGRVETRWT